MVRQHGEVVATTAPGREKSRGRHGEVMVVVAGLSRSNKQQQVVLAWVSGGRRREEKEREKIERLAGPRKWASQGWAEQGKTSREF
jgi:3'-phosphoadenosine 5'-phosphosulfate sulfotransferase (PAPS reductase)/FAD synthetase